MAPQSNPWTFFEENVWEPQFAKSSGTSPHRRQGPATRQLQTDKPRLVLSPDSRVRTHCYQSLFLGPPPPGGPGDGSGLSVSRGNQGFGADISFSQYKTFELSSERRWIRRYAKNRTHRSIGKEIERIRNKESRWQLKKERLCNQMQTERMSSEV